MLLAWAALALAGSSVVRREGRGQGDHEAVASEHQDRTVRKEAKKTTPKRPAVQKARGKRPTSKVHRIHPPEVEAWNFLELNQETQRSHWSGQWSKQARPQHGEAQETDTEEMSEKEEPQKDDGEESSDDSQKEDDEKESADDGLKEDTKAAPESEEADQSLEKEGKSSASAELKDKDDKEEKEEREEKDEKDEKEDGEDRGETEDKDQKEEKAMRESEGEEEDNADTLNPESAEAKDDKESRQDSKDSGDKQEGEETEKEEDGDEEKSQSTEAMMKQSDKELLQELVAAAKWANREEAKPKTAGEDTESTASPHRKKEQNKHGQDPPVPADEPHDFRDEDLVESELEETMLPKKKPSGRGNRQERATHPQKHSKPATDRKSVV